MSVINEHGEGGLRMIDLETMVKSLRLAWLKEIFNGNHGTWKRYLKHQLKSVGGLFFINCNSSLWKRVTAWEQRRVVIFKSHLHLNKLSLICDMWVIKLLTYFKRLGDYLGGRRSKQTRRNLVRNVIAWIVVVMTARF